MVDRYDLAGAEEDEWLSKQDDGEYVLYSDYEALESKLTALVEAAECALTALDIASRQLTQDMKLVLNGRRWGGNDIVRLKVAIDAAKVTP